MKRMFLREAIKKLSFSFYVLLCNQVIIIKWITKKTGTVQKFLQDSFKGAKVPESHVVTILGKGSTNFVEQGVTIKS